MTLTSLVNTLRRLISTFSFNLLERANYKNPHAWVIVLLDVSTSSTSTSFDAATAIQVYILYSI